MRAQEHETTKGPTMPRTVILRHDTPDGQHHFDWMIEPAQTSRAALPAQPRGAGVPAQTRGAGFPARQSNNTPNLITWRLTHPLTHPLNQTEFTATRLPPHRRLYLHYQGPISDNRGQVTRVAEGQAAIHTDQPDQFEVTVTLAGATLHLRGTKHAGDTWRFTTL